MPTIAPDQPVFEARGVSFAYGDTIVLEDINLAVRKGQYLGLIGPNGGGKTTLLKVALGLLRPARGSILWFGGEMRDFKERHRIGYVSQKATEFDSLFPATVGEVVLMGTFSARGLFRRVTAEDRRQADWALEMVNMREFRDRRISDLSGGQKQRVFIARALASKPEILMLDEPTTGVDRETEEHFYGLLSELNQKFNLTLVLVSHDLERIAREASCVAIVDRTLRYYNDPSEAIEKEEIKEFHH